MVRKIKLLHISESMCNLFNLPGFCTFSAEVKGLCGNVSAHYFIGTLLIKYWDNYLCFESFETVMLIYLHLQLSAIYDNIKSPDNYFLEGFTQASTLVTMEFSVSLFYHNISVFAPEQLMHIGRP